MLRVFRSTSGNRSGHDALRTQWSGAARSYVPFRVLHSAAPAVRHVREPSSVPTRLRAAQPRRPGGTSRCIKRSSVAGMTPGK
ncbi:hypothetical protein Pd630_LPD04203 [Rhodococcus opacus PD630]|nr:hypothetical protein Pd630_LPD04203 [Rhodococcus opacus PD630]